MKKNVPCKLTIAFAIGTGTACVLSAAPIAVCLVFVLVALTILLFTMIVYFGGGFLWLFSGGSLNIFSFGKGCGSFAIGIFEFLGPFAKFCFSYITPVATWVTLGAGILTAVFAIVTIAVYQKASEQDNAETDIDIAVESKSAAETENNYPDPRARRRRNGKHGRKREKTTKWFGILCLVLAVVFVVLAFAALFVANMILPQL